MLTLLLSSSLMVHNIFPPRNTDQVPLPSPPREQTISYYVDSTCSISNPFC